MERETWPRERRRPHAGDLPDMYVEKNGLGIYQVLIDSITLGSRKTSISTPMEPRS